MDRTLNTFLRYQQEAEERFERQEEERWKREVEIEEKRRKADQEHEKAIIELLMRGPSHSYHQPATPYSQFDFVHDNTY